MSASHGLTLVDLNAALNPFFQGIVTEAWMKAPADVPEINQKAFGNCIAAVEQTRRTGTSNAVLLHGGTGSGKTHLLSRLREALATTEPDTEPVFAYVMLAAGASRLRRLVRERFVDSLLRPWRDHPSRLAGLLRGIVQGRRWQDVAAGLGLGYGTATVLGHVLEGKFPTQASSWLRGESLPDSVLESMGLRNVDGDDVDEETHAFETIRKLCRLAEPRPVVFCCDQAEALRAGADDKQGFFVYGQLAADIRHMIPNAVLISSIHTNLLTEFQKGMHESNYQRLGEPVVLEPITRSQGQLLLQKRLEAEPLVAEARAAFRQPGLWPIDEQKLEGVYDQGGRTAARRLLHRAAELFEEARNQVLPDEGTIDSYLEETLNEFRRTSKAWQSAAQTDAILEHGLPVLARLLGKPLDTPLAQNQRAVNFTASGVPISLCSQANRGALTRRLGQLASSGQKGIALVRDVRLEFKKTTPKAAAYMDALTGLDARWVRPTAEALAALEALQQLHDGYGTLSHRGESVTQATVADWLRNNLPEPLKRLAEEVFETGGDVAGRLMEKLSQEFVVDVKAAAEWLRVSAEEVIAYAQRRSDQVLLVTGPNPLLCLRVGASPEDSSDAG
jgi:TPR repeat protein